MPDLIFLFQKIRKTYEKFDFIISIVVNRGGQHVVKGRYQALNYTIPIKIIEKSTENGSFLCFSWSE